MLRSSADLDGEAWVPRASRQGLAVFPKRPSGRQLQRGFETDARPTTSGTGYLIAKLQDGQSWYGASSPGASFARLSLRRNDLCVRRREECFQCFADLGVPPQRHCECRCTVAAREESGACSETPGNEVWMDGGDAADFHVCSAGRM